MYSRAFCDRALVCCCAGVDHRPIVGRSADDGGAHTQVRPRTDCRVDCTYALSSTVASRSSTRRNAGCAEGEALDGDDRGRSTIICAVYIGADGSDGS
jgi:hypothetical protein